MINWYIFAPAYALGFGAMLIGLYAEVPDDDDLTYPKAWFGAVIWPVAIVVTVAMMLCQRVHRDVQRIASWLT